MEACLGGRQSGGGNLYRRSGGRVVSDIRPVADGDGAEIAVHIVKRHFGAGSDYYRAGTVVGCSDGDRRMYVVDPGHVADHPCVSDHGTAATATAAATAGFR